MREALLQNRSSTLPLEGREARGRRCVVRDERRDVMGGMLRDGSDARNPSGGNGSN